MTMGGRGVTEPHLRAMRKPRIALLGSVNVDRIWRLEKPLVAGARIRVDETVLRLGGGAVNTAIGVVEAGGLPLVLSRVGAEALGDAALARLGELGIDTASITRKGTPQTILDLLIGPDGDRTILYPPGDKELVTTVPGPIEADALYVNMRLLAEPERLTAWCERMPVVCQIPLNATDPRPAHVLVASRDDLGDRTDAEIWTLGRRIAGPTLRSVVVTRGAGPVTIFSEQGTRSITVPGEPLADTDLTGAGDAFAAGLVVALGRSDEVAAAVLEGCRVAREVLTARPSLDLASF